MRLQRFGAIGLAPAAAQACGERKLARVEHVHRDEVADAKRR